MTVRVTPRAGGNSIDGLTPDGIVRVRVAAAPADGAANRALIGVLSDLLAIAPSRVTIVAGHSGRTKVVDIAGVSELAIRSAIAGLS